jgi:hypothetical protein
MSCLLRNAAQKLLHLVCSQDPIAFILVALAKLAGKSAFAVSGRLDAENLVES